jgi:hypothetical protein
MMLSFAGPGSYMFSDVNMINVNFSFARNNMPDCFVSPIDSHGSLLPLLSILEGIYTQACTMEVLREGAY